MDKLLKMDELVSIVVSVYNGEKYLARCLDSLTNQKYNQIEIILVDDGSTDTSGVICDDYMKKDSRIRVIHQKNGGISAARNAGLETAQGEYLVFCDADDIVTEYYVENLYRSIKSTDADMSVCGYQYYKEGDIIQKGFPYNQDKIKIVDTKECLERAFYQDQMYTTIWGKLFKKNIWKNLVFPVGRLYEDIPTMYQAIFDSKKVVIIENIDYYYAINEGSITQKPFSMREMDAIDFMDEVGERVNKEYPDLMHAYRTRAYLLHAFIMFKIQPKEHIEVRKNLWTRMKSIRKEVLSDSRVGKQSKMIALSSYLGYSITYRLYRMVKK